MARKKTPSRTRAKKSASRSAAATPIASRPLRKTPHTFFSTQVHVDQQKYSRYVCDSRAIPHEIDGLKPVQRRILWAMWNSSSRNNFTKTVKMAGLAMGYHPHGDKSIQDALSAMAQDFPFANNYPLVAGEGTFGDIVDPSAVASPRYTEVKISDFAKDVGFFESLPDIDYALNYDETEDEPIFFVGKIPVVLLNPIMGIATGFRCNIPGHNLTDVVESMKEFLKKGKPKKLAPWYKGYEGFMEFRKNDAGEPVLSTGFGFKKMDGAMYLTAAPQNWNRTKVIDYLETLLDNKESPLKDYVDYCTDTYKIELIFKRGWSPTTENLNKLFSRVNNETLVYNVITTEGSLENHGPEAIIKRFCKFRKLHLIKRFKRLSALEQEKISRNSELIRFINEKWNQKVTSIKSKSDFEGQLQKAKFKHFEWLASLPVYRMTKEEVRKCEEAIVEAKAQYKLFQSYVKQDKALTKFMIDEIETLRDKWDAA